MRRIWEAVLDFNDAHGKVTAVLVALVAGYALGKLL